METYRFEYSDVDAPDKVYSIDYQPLMSGDAEQAFIFEMSVNGFDVEVISAVKISE